MDTAYFANKKSCFLPIIFMVLLTGCSQPETSGIGYRLISILEPTTNTPIEVALWYPTSEPAKSTRLDTFRENLAIDAAPDSNNGLIVLSHGFAGSSLSHIDTSVYLAKSGFLVATPTHPDLAGLKSGNPQLDPLVIRPKIISLTLDSLLNIEPFNNTFPQQNIGILGHSIGAYTALSALGGQPSFKELPEYCNTIPSDELLCAPWANERFGAITKSLNFEQDTRIRAALLLAPAYGPLFNQKALSNIDVPIKIYSAAKDRELIEPFHSERLKSSLPRMPEHEVIANAGHFIFLSPCSNRLKQKAPHFCIDPEGVDREAIHSKLNAGIAQFFSRAFKINGEAK